MRATAPFYRLGKWGSEMEDIQLVSCGTKVKPKCTIPATAQTHSSVFAVSLSEILTSRENLILKPRMQSLLLLIFKNPLDSWTERNGYGFGSQKCIC